MKGISPMIATILLIAFTVAVGGILSVWFSTTTTSQTTILTQDFTCLEWKDITEQNTLWNGGWCDFQCENPPCQQRVGGGCSNCPNGIAANITDSYYISKYNSSSKIYCEDDYVVISTIQPICVKRQNSQQVQDLINGTWMNCRNESVRVTIPCADTVRFSGCFNTVNQTICNVSAIQ